MNALANNDVTVQQRAVLLREEIKRWEELIGAIEERAVDTADGTILGMMEAFLRSARQMIDSTIQPQPAKDAKQFPFSPMAEPQEITLPSFPLPGKGVPVKAKKGKERFPDPAILRTLNDVSDS